MGAWHWDSGGLCKLVARVALAVAVLRGATAASAAPPAAGMPVVQYETVEAGTERVLSTAWGWTEPADGDPQNIAVLSQTIFTQGGEWRVRALFTRDLPPRCVEWQGTLTDKNGRVVSATHSHWVAEAFPLLRVPFPADAYPLQAPMGYVVTRLGLGQRRSASFHTILGEALAQIDLWVDGRERLRVSAGDFDCYRIRMRANAQSLFPRLPGFLKPVLSFFVPTYTLWLTATEPQLLVQFRGQMGPPGSRELLVRLLNVGQ